jgi:hypothetical protein
MSILLPAVRPMLLTRRLVPRANGRNAACRKADADREALSYMKLTTCAVT